ncbi:hypothetical protein IEQ34_020233 [Dendrobium chrysotoxum]|uniref:VQ domain-containing protein n=1 Tax=Dendrobium chrysotoxum TaxID=161865 RepID=A0AAV7G0D6_DENCH|nr:hypothetical protein IEQ34_020233 [Dendrobium chrysotoxum]
MDHLLTLERETFEISKPKVRIVHLFPPEIIKTDPANFRELVQKLTGKPQKKKKKKKITELIKNHEVKEEEEEREKLMSGLQDEDGFLHGLSDFPLLPLLNTSYMDLIEEDKSFKS